MFALSLVYLALTCAPDRNLDLTDLHSELLYTNYIEGKLDYLINNQAYIKVKVNEFGEAVEVEVTCSSSPASNNKLIKFIRNLRFKSGARTVYFEIGGWLRRNTVDLDQFKMDARYQFGPLALGETLSKSEELLEKKASDFGCKIISINPPEAQRFEFLNGKSNYTFWFSKVHGDWLLTRVTQEIQNAQRLQKQLSAIFGVADLSREKMFVWRKNDVEILLWREYKKDYLTTEMSGMACP